MRLNDFIYESGIELNLQGSSKNEVIDSLVQTLRQVLEVENPDQIIALLQEREKLSTTGIGRGVAVPHCRTSAVDKMTVIIGRMEHGIDFQALDQQPVRLFFLLVAPENSGPVHLKVLAKIARITKDSSIRDELMRLETAEQMLQYLDSSEESLN